MKIKSKIKQLNVQVSLYFLLSSALIIALLGGILYYSISNIIMNDVYKKTSDAIKHESYYLELYLNKTANLVELLAEHPKTINFLENGDSKSKVDLTSLNSFIKETDESIISIVIVSKTGEVFPEMYNSDMKTSEDMMSESWYVSAVENKLMPVLTSVRRQAFTTDKDKWVISLSQEIVNSNGEHLGVLLMDVKYEFIEAYLSKLDLGEKGFAFIVTTDGDMVYHKDTSYFTDTKKVSELIRICEFGDGYKSEMDLVTFKTSVKNTNWILVGLSSLDSLKDIRRQLIETVIFVGLILLVIAVGGNLFISRKITNPIKELEIAMELFEGGIKKVEVTNNGCTESESLANHYNLMVDRITNLMIDIKGNEKKMRDFELKALQSQINPHFLYNTLDTIIWMAEFGDSEKVISLTKSLAGFFRLSLNQGRELVSLQDEIDHIKQYLAIQKVRYIDKLEYEFVVDKLLLDQKIPKISLQPIVENAIYHGIRESDNGGKITISVLKEKDIILIIISDDGVGFDTKSKASTKTKLGGIGLRNVDERLKLYFGTDYGLVVNSEIGNGTDVKIKIPFN